VIGRTRALQVVAAGAAVLVTGGTAWATTVSSNGGSHSAGVHAMAVDSTNASTSEATEPTDRVTEPTDQVTEPTDRVTEPTDQVTEPTDNTTTTVSQPGETTTTLPCATHDGQDDNNAQGDVGSIGNDSTDGQHSESGSGQHVGAVSPDEQRGECDDAGEGNDSQGDNEDHAPSVTTSTTPGTSPSRSGDHSSWGGGD
jgi:hypothetical protein